MDRFVIVLLVLCGASSAAPGQTLTEHLLAEGVAALAQAARKEGDPQRGALVFHQPYLACTKCHTAAEGAPLGPDLTKLEKTTTAEHLVESVLLPSKVIRKGYEPITVLTTAGKSLTGLLMKEDKDTLVIRDPASGKPITLKSDEIDERQVSKTSIMPEGLANQLASRQQFLDLAHYLIQVHEGGPTRAAQLQPPASLLVVQVPEYEKQVDHAGLLADWSRGAVAAAAFRRGEAIYSRLCVNCHGTRDVPGSLPTSAKFARDRLKNGSDPYRMYQTLTHGFGQMAAQTWMVPQQKYDVIHYVREVYFQPHNPTQYTRIDAAYLASLPKGTTRGPAPSNVEPWSAMNYGPFLIATYEAPMSGAERERINFAYKGIAVRLDPGPGGVARGRHWMVYEHDTLRLSAAWSKAGDTDPTFIDWNGINFNGRHQIHPRLSGAVHLANPSGPGWANPATGRFADPRLQGRDGRRYGPLPAEWAKYRGLYQHGEKVVLSYTVGTTSVLETPAVVPPAGEPIFTRGFEIGPRDRDLTLRVATPPDAGRRLRTVALADGKGGKDTLPVAILDAGGPGRTIAAGVSGAVKGAAWKQDSDGALLLRLPAGKMPLRFTLALQTGKPGDDLTDVVTQPVVDLAPLRRGGPRRWPEVLTTTATLGSDAGPFAVDALTVPASNPWFCQMRLTGFDFFDDANRAAVCTWDGDVWLVSGLTALAARAAGDGPRTVPLQWQRIASGLFQPLGLKIVKGRIFVTCRDQLVALHDLNGDGETDFYECFNSDHQVTEHFHEFAMGLQIDARGDFYYAKSARHALPALVPHHGTLLRIRADGSRTDILANGFRAANGVCLNPDGTFVVTDQEGHWTPKNRINWVTPPPPGARPPFYGNLFGYHDVTDAADTAMEQPLCWITNAFDRSPAELLWVTSDAWKPLQGALLNLSYGYGKVYVVPFETVAGKKQGGMCELPLPPFPTGVMRGRFHPRDGQLYLCGMFAWAGNATQPGGFYRLRYTGKPLHLPVALRARATGVQVTFSAPLDRATATDPARYEVRAWGLKRTANYGSDHINERALPVTAVRLCADNRTVFLTIPGLAPTWGMSIRASLKGAGGEAVPLLIHNTIHAFPNKP